VRRHTAQDVGHLLMINQRPRFVDVSIRFQIALTITGPRNWLRKPVAYVLRLDGGGSIEGCWHYFHSRSVGPSCGSVYISSMARYGYIRCCNARLSCCAESPTGPLRPSISSVTSPAAHALCGTFFVGSSPLLYCWV